MMKSKSAFSRQKEASPDLEAGLKEICELEKIDAYVNEQAYESIPESIGNMVSEAVFTSASNVERFFHMLPGECIRGNSILDR